MKHPAYAGFGEGPYPEGWIVGGLTCFQWPISQLELGLAKIRVRVISGPDKSENGQKRHTRTLFEI